MGPDGAGKRTFADLITGEGPSTKGTWIRGQSLVGMVGANLGGHWRSSKTKGFGQSDMCFDFELVCHAKERLSLCLILHGGQGEVIGCELPGLAPFAAPRRVRSPMVERGLPLRCGQARIVLFSMKPWLPSREEP